MLSLQRFLVGFQQLAGLLGFPGSVEPIYALIANEPQCLAQVHDDDQVVWLYFTLAIFGQMLDDGQAV